MRYSLVVGATCLMQFALASLVNVTIDDKYGDPQAGSQIVYSPNGAWNDETQQCSATCAKPLDASRIHNGTWHNSTFLPPSGSSNDDSSQIPTASVIFNGSALYVYCVIAHSSNSDDGISDMTFFIDNEVVGYFSATDPTGNQFNYQYNVPVYVNHSIPSGIHVFTLQNGHRKGQKSVVMLDSIVYTHSHGGTDSVKLLDAALSQSQPEARSRRGVLIGSLIGSLLGLLFIAPGIYLCVRYHKRRERLAPSQRYAARKPTGRCEWFEERRMAPVMKNMSIDLLPEMEEARVPPRRPSYPEALRDFIANSARTEGTSSASQGTSQREPPLRPGRTFRVMNR